MKKIILSILLVLLLFNNAQPCFGPELYVAYERGNISSYNIANLIDTYIKEKTGISVILKEVTKEEIKTLIQKEAIDIITFPIKEDKVTPFPLSFDKKITIYYRTKIQEDLRFGSLIEALKNLSKNLSLKDMEDLNKIIEKKGKIKRTIKEYLMERGLW